MSDMVERHRRKKIKMAGLIKRSKHREKKEN